MKAKLQILFALIAVLLPTAAKAQDIDMYQILSSVVKEMNMECPMTIDDESKITSFSLDHSYLTMNFQFTTEDVDFDMFNDDNKKLLKEMISNMVSEDEGFKVLKTFCAQAGCDMKVNLRDLKGATLDIILPCR